MTALQTAKKKLRKHMREVLSTITKEDVLAESRQVMDRILAMPQYVNAKNISIYLSMPTGEITTDGIVRDAFDRGKGVYVPYFYRRNPATASDAGSPSSIMDMLKLSSLQDYESLTSDKWGIPSLSNDGIESRKNSFGGLGKSEDRVEITPSSGVESCLDLILLPGMAFDEACGRLGHGKGFYDFFLHRTRLAYAKAGIAMPYLAALALRKQVLPSTEHVPRGPTDCPVDVVVQADGDRS